MAEEQMKDASNRAWFRDSLRVFHDSRAGEPTPSLQRTHEGSMRAACESSLPAHLYTL
jgi:hypothetical protein